ncbi:amino acid transporter [Clostridium botulinum]|uniref:amino acid transporter n=1 Tax=Clostridium botulinum TaxID=1491 RepID=UPI001788A357|nr:amino acid transporter [Clostridium botulinum]MBE1304532.1 amino acid transporter [Clostridium botulinum]
MKKLIITCKDGSKVTYTMKDFVDHMKYFKRHLGSRMATAILQQYPKKDNEPIDILKDWEEKKMIS